MARSFLAAIVIALLSIFLIANPEAVGLTVADIDPSRRYKLEEIDLSGEHAFFKRRGGLRDDDERATLVSGLESAS